jgi:hypothetical protein
MESPKITPDLIVEYFNFLFDFLRKPRVCMASYVQGEEGEQSCKAAIRGKLAWYAIVSVAVATLFVQIGAAIGMAPDSSSSIVVLNKIGILALPFATLVSIIVGSACAHVLVKIVGLFSRAMGHDLFDGEVNNSVNAALAFSALMIPLFTLVIIVIRIAAAQQVDPGPALLIAVVVPVSLAAWFYLIAAFAGAHTLAWGHAVYLFGGTTALLVYVGKLLGTGS